MVSAKSAAPANPKSKPKPRERPGRCLSQTQAINAPNSGVVEFKIEDIPVEMNITA
jgi:hypothetical protein